MGQEISKSHFQKHDFKRFDLKLKNETKQLQQWFLKKCFSSQGSVGGFETEAWLTDHNCDPVPLNEQFIKQSENPTIVPELSKFIIEINSEPHALGGHSLSKMESELTLTWNHCGQTARKMGSQLIMHGILPTVTEQQLNLDNMSPSARYRALNEQILRLRKGEPIQLNIRSREQLRIAHCDVMLESAATAFQIHLQVNQEHAVRYYNAACIASAPLIAASANSPYLFNKELWDETRIPLFEQSVNQKGEEHIQRVSFGHGYIKSSLFEYFAYNLKKFPILLPASQDHDTNPLPHLRFHNGTIWNWNRPLIGFDNDGRPHLRIEHRALPAGPSVLDMISNAALFYGLLFALGNENQPPENSITFEQARKNFYSAAHSGLDATIEWKNRKTVTVRSLLLDELLQQAHQGLEQQQFNQEDIKYYLGIIKERVQSKRNGSHWQRDYIAKHGSDMHELTQAYVKRQSSGLPIHQWLI